jgi:hypothetical protein
VTKADRIAPTLVVFGEAGDAPTLEVIAWEALGLEVDA